ncbi:MAG: acetyl-CoA carboxylase biotin carboxyl carrier protein subunit [Myxococcales bacterium]|nr:acetyl-CoA carboxylase biotin carboxyl carrier protein subunit [Myxococcales bacterium]MCB9521769.1 biotin/lipoyl-binding protein [Myxococcales bacterium]
MRYTIEHGGEPVTVDVRRLGADRFLVQIGDGPAKVVEAHADAFGVHLLDGPASHRVRLADDGKQAWVRGHAFKAEALDPQAARRRSRQQGGAAGGGDRVITSPMPGRIVKVLVAEGDTVQVGQGVVIVEAMKMENELRAELAGVVASVHCKADDRVEGGARLVVIDPAEG